MGYGVNQWVGQRIPARGAGSSKASSTKTRKRSARGSARRAKRKPASSRSRAASKKKRWTFSNYGPVDAQGYSAYQKQQRPQSPWEAHDARDY